MKSCIKTRDLAKDVSSYIVTFEKSLKKIVKVIRSNESRHSTSVKSEILKVTKIQFQAKYDLTKG